MKEIINQDMDIQELEEQYGIIELSNALLNDVRTNLNSTEVFSFPIAELSTLGTGISSLIPELNTITQTTSISGSGLYRIANFANGDKLKAAKDGTFWGSLKTTTGKSKMMKISEAGTLTETTKTVKAFDPTTMLIAATLYSIEKDLDEIKAMQKKILNFLQIEKEASIKADIEALTKIITNYKHTWNNKLQVSSNHQIVNDIQIRARRDINSYIKQINTTISSKQFIVAQSKVNSTYNELEKMFKYYRLSLYSFSLASILEILLSQNTNTEYISKVKHEIENLSSSYRKTFEAGSIYLENLGKSELEANLVKGLGITSKAIGKTIGHIPLIKQGHVDEFLQDSGSHLQKNARGMKNKSVEQFSTLNNPGTKIFINKIEDMEIIYNYNRQIYFDKQNIYLMS